MTSEERIAELLKRIYERSYDIPMSSYAVSDGDTVNPIQYFGNVDKYGHWYILKNDTTANTYRYASGTTDYINAWTNRATLVYDYFFNTTFITNS